MRITIILAILLSGGVFLGSCNLSFAQNSDIGYSQIYPSSHFYFLKAVRENLEMHFAQTDRVKMIRQLEFATRRIREVKSLIKKNHQDFIEPTLERYMAYIKTVLDSGSRDNELLNHTIATHLAVLEKSYEEVENHRAKIAIRKTIFRLTEKPAIKRDIKIKGCEFLSKEATSSALNEVERVIFTERAKSCYL